MIAATVIGGANLMGGYGTAFGAVIGSAFLEVIRNALLMAGIDSNWQGAFVGAFIILAVLLGMQTGGTSLRALWQHCAYAAPLGNAEGTCRERRQRGGVNEKNSMSVGDRRRAASDATIVMRRNV